MANKKLRKSFRKRGSRRIKAYSPHKTISIRGTNGSFLPQSVTTVHNYCEFYSMSAAGGQLIPQKFNLNSVFDPDLSGGGHQPMGRDQLAALYSRYRVDKVKVKVQWSKVTDGVIGFHAMIANNDATTLTQTPSNIMEQSFQKSGTTSYANGGSKTTVGFSKTFDLATITGVSKSKYKSDDNYQALVGSDPTEVIILHCMCGDVLLSSAYNAVLTIKLQYFTTWFDPIVVGQS